MKKLLAAGLMLVMFSLTDANVYVKPQYCDCNGIGVNPQPKSQTDIRKAINEVELKMGNWMNEFLLYLGLE